LPFSSDNPDCMRRRVKEATAIVGRGINGNWFFMINWRDVSFREIGDRFNINAPLQPRFGNGRAGEVKKQIPSSQLV